MITITKKQAHSAFENASHLTSEQLLQLCSFQELMQFYVTLKANPVNGLFDACLPLAIPIATMQHWTGYKDHITESEATFGPSTGQVPHNLVQTALVNRISEVLRI